MSGRGPLGARLPPPTGDQHKRRLPDGSESQYHGGSFASYMSGKINKLEEQFAANQAGQQKSELFAGVGIHVNGLTTPSHLVRGRCQWARVQAEEGFVERNACQCGLALVSTASWFATWATGWQPGILNSSTGTRFLATRAPLPCMNNHRS